MANEISWAALQATGALAAHVLADKVRALLGDPTDLRAFIVEDEFAANQGAAATRVGQYDAHHEFEAAASEIDASAITNQDIGDTGFTHTLAHYKQIFQVSGLNTLVAKSGGINLDLLAMVLANGVGLTYTSLVGDLVPSLINNVGSTGADMSVDYFFDAHYRLNTQHASNDRAMVLRPKAMNEFIESLRGETGAMQFSQDAQDMLAPSGPAFQGVFFKTAIFSTDYIDADGGVTYYQNVMFERGCYARQSGPASARTPHIANVSFIDMGELLIVFDYDAGNDLESIIGHLYISVAEAEDNRGVEIRSQVA